MAKEEKKAYKYRFRLLVGTHRSEGTYRTTEHGEVISNNDGLRYVAKNPHIPSTQVPGYIGDIIETDLDLKALFDRPGNIPKFEDITHGAAMAAMTPESIDQQVAELLRKKAEMVNAQGSEKTHGDRTLESMTVEELKKLAAEEEIDLGKATKKEDIIRIIQSSPVMA